jgi:endoglucanase
VHRKSKPTDFARVEPWKFRAPQEHQIFLRLPSRLQPGRRYVLSSAGGLLPDVSFVFDPATLRSEAVHVSHLGFRPDDPAKVAFLSCWAGSGGAVDYPPGLAFRVLDERTGKAVFEGKTSLSKAGNDLTEDAYKRNFNGTDVYEMDFSALSVPGTYRVSVEGIGCSFPFEVGADVWRKAFFVAARGFFHQRSGPALGPPHTTFKRPRCFHPADGLRVLHSECGLIDSGNGLNARRTDKDNFGNLVKGRTDTVVNDAWGGYQDAGDWDRRIQHLEPSRLLLELDEFFPEFFAGLSLNIPESGGPLPDIIDEALFNLDCYRRMQTPEGGIRGGIESAEHPRQGEASWQESLDVLAYAPDPWSSCLYAATAAQASERLAKIRPDLAAAYRESALRAAAWAEKALPGRPAGDPHGVRDARNLAAAWLFRLTGDRAWHDLFLATTVFKDPGAELFVWNKHDQREAAWVYARTGRAGTDAAVRENATGAILREAQDRVESIRLAGFRWAKFKWMPLVGGALSSPDAVPLLRAHALRGDAAHLRAAVLACQTGAGANPGNLCYTTGLGRRSPQHPLHVDSRISRQPPPPGLTVYGPLDPKQQKDHWGQKLVAPYVFPDVLTWPAIEAYWDVFWYPEMCEYTVMQTLMNTAYAWGYLAGRK